MIDITQVYDYYLITAFGRLVSSANKTTYESYDPRTPKPTADSGNDAGKIFDPAVGTIMKLKPNQDPDSLVFHDRLLENITPTEYEDLYGGFSSQTQGVQACRSAYKIIDTGGGVMDYDWVITPDFAVFEPYLPDIVEYDIDSNEISRRRPVAGESFLAGYAGSDPINV